MTTETESGERRRGGIAADRIRILIVDDHALFRVGISNILSREREFDVVGEAADGRSAVEMVSMVPRTSCSWTCRCPPRRPRDDPADRREFPAMPSS